MKKKNRTILLVIALILLFFLLILLTNVYFNYINVKSKQVLLDRKIEDINNHYNEFVVTNKKTKIYIKDNNEFVEYGEINRDVTLTLKEKDGDYFLIDGLNFYINYIDVNPIEEYTINNRYSNYIYFNNNIITKESTSFYDVENNFLYTIKKSFDFKVLVKNTDSYGVIYNNTLVYVKKEDVEKIYDNTNTNETSKSRIRTLTYHFIYDEQEHSCNEIICHTFEQFESHLKYIRENDYFTLTLNELELYLDGKINIPQKSIVLTADDGTTFDAGALELLKKYDANMTLFVITSWVDPNNFDSDYLELESHTNNMHNQYECVGQGSQGGGILCLDEETILEDLRISQERVGGSKYFAYPFYDYNERAIELLKKSGFTMAFIGIHNTEGYAYPNSTHKYKVPRLAILSTTTMDEFISYLN